MQFQFRVDAFNVITHTNFTAPSGSLSVTEVGTAATFATRRLRQDHGHSTLSHDASLSALRFLSFSSRYIYLDSLIPVKDNNNG